MTLTANEIIRIMKIARYKAAMNQDKTIRIINCKQQLAELDRYFWFEDMPEEEYIERFDEIKERLNKLEEEDD
jgi:chromosome condensin MukBEF ATPase and DNA-binding subunit MukB